MIRLQAIPVTLDAAAGEDSPRTITGVAVPWDVTATVSDGTKVSFLRGAFDLEAKNPKLLENHDSAQLRGVVTELADSEEGLLFTAKFAKTRASDDAIELVKAGAYDSVSVGAIPLKFTMKKDGTMLVSSASLEEISLVASPAFKDAVITEIAASEPEPEEEATETPNNDTSEEETMSQETPVEASQPDVIQTPLFATAKREFKMPSAGEWISAQMQGGAVAAEFNARLRAAAPDVVTSDIPGVLPLPIVQPIYNNFRGLRPVIDAVGVRQLPQSGKVFIRPVVTTHTSIGAATENTAVTAGTFVVDDVQITKGIYGGYVEISEASMDWSSPEVLGAMLDDMGRIYANATDNVAADNLVAGASVTSAFAAASETDPSYWQSWVSAAATTILSGSNGNLPTHMFVSPDFWGTLMGLSDTADRPLFPAVGPMNAYGNLMPGQPNGIAFGLQVVVDRNFAAATIILGDASGYEIFEQQKGAISIDVPSTLSRTIAFRGYLATLMIDSSKFVKAAFV